MCVMWMEGWRRWLETKLGKIETNDNAPDFCQELFLLNQQLFHKPNPKCHSPGIIYSRFEVLSFASDHRFGCIGDGSVVSKGSKLGSGGGILTGSFDHIV